MIIVAGISGRSLSVIAPYTGEIVAVRTLPRAPREFVTALREIFAGVRVRFWIAEPDAERAGYALAALGWPFVVLPLTAKRVPKHPKFSPAELRAVALAAYGAKEVAA